MPDRRILLLITDLEIGGTPTVVRELALRLRELPDVQIDVASLKDIGPVGALLAAQGVPVRPMNASWSLSFPLVVRRLRKLIVDKQIDTVMSFLVHANVIAAFATPRGVRLFQSIQTTQPRPKWHWLAQRLVFNRAERIVVPSPSIAAVAQSRSSIPSERVTVIPNAVDADAFPLSEIPRSNPEHYPIGFIGRLDPVKRIPDLIDAVLPLSDRVTLDIFGDGPERIRLERQINSTGSIALRGTVRSPQEALARIGLLVLPSEAEGFPLVLIEAMAAGVPIVATNAPGIRDVIEDGVNGLLVPIGDRDALSAAIERIVDDVALRARLIENGLRIVRARYTWQTVLPMYRELLKL
jgi:glycosyltransferase involved in cell wall biosynthesis